MFNILIQCKAKTLAVQKNQLQDKIAKRYQCQWLLRKSVPSHSTVAHSTVVEEGTLVSESSCHNSGQQDISNKTKKRCKRSYEDIEKEVAAVEKEKFSLEQNAILVSVEKEKT